jgi:hypothetical protein
LLPTSPFKAVAYGVDDITLGFDMEGSKSVLSSVQLLAWVALPASQVNGE